MTENKNQKAKVWVYAVILFTSAFVVLMLTALSQIRFNKYVNEYKSQIYTQAGENQKFQVNLASALDENTKLKGDINSLKSEISSLNEKISELQKVPGQLNSEFEAKLSPYNALLQAQIEYDKGNIASCAEILIKINTSELSAEQSILYSKLAGFSLKKAAYQKYNEGYKNFKNKEYTLARDNFAKSLMFADNEYYSDDINYYLAYISFKEKDYDTAAAYIRKLNEKYPNSNYITDANQLLKQMEKG